MINSVHSHWQCRLKIRCALYLAFEWRVQTWYLNLQQYIQVISRQSITGEQGENFCKTLPAPFEHPDLGFEEELSIEKNKLRALGFTMSPNSTKKVIASWSVTQTKDYHKLYGFLIPYYIWVLLQRLISSRERLKLCSWAWCVSKQKSNSPTSPHTSSVLEK